MCTLSVFCCGLVWGLVSYSRGYERFGIGSLRLYICDSDEKEGERTCKCTLSLFC